MPTTVTTQTELDAALDAKEDLIYIESPSGVWLTVTKTDSSSVEAWGSSRVVARGSSRVVARDSSRVVARESSSVVARDSSSVVARESSRVEARDSSSVEAWESSRVVACSCVAVHLHSAKATVQGGVVIDITALDLTDPATWLDYRGVKVTDGKALLYKAVDSDLCAGQAYMKTTYQIGEVVTAADWEATKRCGQGLHFGVSPMAAAGYFNGDGEPRFLAVEVDAAGVVPLDDKCKAQSCTVLREVDRWGDPVEVSA
mgnify:FL=1